MCKNPESQETPTGQRIMTAALKLRDADIAKLAARKCLPKNQALRQKVYHERGPSGPARGPFTDLGPEGVQAGAYGPGRLATTR